LTFGRGICATIWVSVCDCVQTAVCELCSHILPPSPHPLALPHNQTWIRFPWSLSRSYAPTPTQLHTLSLLSSPPHTHPHPHLLPRSQMSGRRRRASFMDARPYDATTDFHAGTVRVGRHYNTLHCTQTTAYTHARLHTLHPCLCSSVITVSSFGALQAGVVVLSSVRVLPCCSAHAVPMFWDSLWMCVRMGGVESSACVASCL
jgi:hypothetical protein